MLWLLPRGDRVLNARTPIFGYHIAWDGQCFFPVFGIARQRVQSMYRVRKCIRASIPDITQNDSLNLTWQSTVYRFRDVGHQFERMADNRAVARTFCPQLSMQK